MRIRTLELQDFKSFKAAKIDLRPGLNIFVGPNNVGKSTLAQAVRGFFDDNERVSLSPPDHSANIQGKNQDAFATTGITLDVPEKVRQDVIEQAYRGLAQVERIHATNFCRQVRLTLRFLKSRIAADVEISNIKDDQPWLSIYRVAASGDNSSYQNLRLHLTKEDASTERPIPTAALKESSSGSSGNGLRSFSPGGSLEPLGKWWDSLRKTGTAWLKAERHFDYTRPIRGETVLKPDARNLVDVLHSLKNNDADTSARLFEELRRIFPEVTLLQTPVGEWRQDEGTHTTVAIRTALFPKTDVDLEHVSSGIRQVLAILTHVLTTPQGAVILIEEPEIHLHPQVLRQVYRFLQREAENHQILVLTHSPILAGVADASELWTVLPDSLGSVCEPFSLENIKRIQTSLGIAPSDLFEDEVVLFVEGIDDIEVIQTLLPRLSASVRLDRVRIIDAEGWNNITFYADARLIQARRVRPQVFLLFDGDVHRGENQILYERSMKTLALAPERTLVLPHGSLEHYLLDAEAICKSFPDLFPTLEAAQEAIAGVANKKNRKRALEAVLQARGKFAARPDKVRIAGHLNIQTIEPTVRGFLEAVADASRGVRAKVEQAQVTV